MISSTYGFRFKHQAKDCYLAVHMSLLIPTIRTTEDWLNHVLRSQKLSVIMELRYFSVTWIFQPSAGTHMMRFPLSFCQLTIVAIMISLYQRNCSIMAGFDIMAGPPVQKLLETIFCSRHDEIEISCPASALYDGFGSSNAHHPVSLTYAGFHVTHINDCSPRTQLDFDKTILAWCSTFKGFIGTRS